MSTDPDSAFPQMSGPAAVRRCLCEYTSASNVDGGIDNDDGRLPWDYAVLCSACSKRALQPHRERYEQALRERDLARNECAQALARLNNTSQNQQNMLDGEGVSEGTSSTPARFSELQFESQRLRDRRAQLQQQCAAMAVEVAALAVKNEERQAALFLKDDKPHPAECQRQHLRRLEESVCEGSLKEAIQNSREHSRILRFQWALKGFAMHRLDVRAEDIHDPSSREHSSTEATHNSTAPKNRSEEIRLKKPKGIGKVGGLPLPHAGPELYGVLPPQELQSALRLVASITSTVARCLGIILPHPILLQRPSNYSQQSDIIHAAAMSQRNSSQDPSTMQKNNSSVMKMDSKKDSSPDSTSTEELQALLESTLDDTDDNSRTCSSSSRQGLEGRANAIVVPPSMDPALVAQRVRHATAAVLAESDNTNKSSSPSSQYALAAGVMYQDEFAIALQLLQNNIIALCIRAGVPVAKLWPAEAILLNLYALQVFCEDQVKKLLK